MENEIPLQSEKCKVGKSLNHCLCTVSLKGGKIGFEGSIHSVGKIWLYLLV